MLLHAVFLQIIKFLVLWADVYVTITAHVCTGEGGGRGWNEFEIILDEGHNTHIIMLYVCYIYVLDNLCVVIYTVHPLLYHCHYYNDNWHNIVIYYPKTCTLCSSYPVYQASSSSPVGIIRTILLVLNIFHRTHGSPCAGFYTKDPQISSWVVFIEICLSWFIILNKHKSFLCTGIRITLTALGGWGRCKIMMWCYGLGTIFWSTHVASPLDVHGVKSALLCLKTNALFLMSVMTNHFWPPLSSMLSIVSLSLQPLAAFSWIKVHTVVGAWRVLPQTQKTLKSPSFWCDLRGFISMGWPWGYSHLLPWPYRDMTYSPLLPFKEQERKTNIAQWLSSIYKLCNIFAFSAVSEIILTWNPPQIIMQPFQ